MLKITDSLSDGKNTNLVILIESKADLKNYEIFDWEDNVQFKIDKTLEEKKNSSFNIFVWEENIESIYFLFYLDKKEKSLEEFLGEQFIKLPKKLTIIPNKENREILLLDMAFLAKYEFNKYKAEAKELEIYFISENKEILETRYKTIENIILARDLNNTWSNDKTPEKIVDYVKSFKLKKTKVKYFSSKDIEKEWLNLITAVWGGSSNKPAMIIFEKIVDKNAPTHAIIGKWITYDSGGLNIKDAFWLPLMKDDMWGAGTVIHLMKELEDKQLNINLIAVVPLAENMLWEWAYRPWDIFKSYSWKTVEILNTDAEGRLILADAMSYASKNYELSSITTIATLTWACLYALGFNYAGIMWNNKLFINKLLNQSKKHYEQYWELPFWNYYQEAVKGTISDTVNTNSKKIFAGSSEWGAFLSEFVLNDEPFTHIDIAWSSNRMDNYKIFAKWATWFGIDSLAKFFSELEK